MYCHGNVNHEWNNYFIVFLIMFSMVLPTSAIMYASGSTVNSDDASDSEFSEDSFASDSGSTDNSDGNQILGLLMITPTHPQILGLLMIMLIYQQHLRKIIPLYQVNLR